MKEIPILFSTPMVQALLAGRKTQTRRIVKEKAVPVRDEIIDGKRMMKPAGWPLLPESEYKEKFCNYGKPGDMLWVRETLFQNGELGLEYVADKEWISEDIIPDDYGPYGGDYAFRNIPNIHMPKWAARIWLQVEDVRVERLHDISEEDAIAEGCESRFHRCGGFGYYEAGGETQSCECLSWEGGRYYMGFKDLWGEINGAESWDANPWVWVVTYKVLSTTGKPEIIQPLQDEKQKEDSNGKDN
jgi:hypothetical protein